MTGRELRRRRYGAAGLVLAAALLAPNVMAQSEQGVRAELAAPLRAAQDLLAQKKYAEALAQLAQADRVGASRPPETYVLERLRAAAAAGAGNEQQAARAIEAALATGQAPAGEQPGLLEALAGTYYRLKDWPAAAAAATRALAVAPANARLRLMLAQAQYLAQDYAGAAQSLETALQQQQGAGPPPQAQLELLGSSYQKLKNTQAYMRVLERLLAHHPKKEYWADLLAHVESQPGFARDMVIDVLRLQLRVDAFSEAGEYVDLAQQALKAGFAAEASRVLQAGVDAKLLGTGPQEGEHRGLIAQVRKLAQEDLAAKDPLPAPGDAGRLFNAGYNRVLQGETRSGLELMARALQTPGMPRTMLARLRLGQAWMLAGDKARALAAFRAVEKEAAQAKDDGGVGGLARLWALQAGQS